MQSIFHRKGSKISIQEIQVPTALYQKHLDSIQTQNIGGAGDQPPACLDHLVYTSDRASTPWTQQRWECMRFVVHWRSRYVFPPVVWHGLHTGDRIVYQATRGDHRADISDQATQTAAFDDGLLGNGNQIGRERRKKRELGIPLPSSEILLCEGTLALQSGVASGKIGEGEDCIQVWGAFQEAKCSIRGIIFN